MLFSILIPVYNVEKYLDECLNSVLNQTEQNFEVILIDDGSKDRSGEICDQWAVEYPDKIMVFHQENRGSLLTRRTGITKSKGDFCIFVDSDDYLRLDTLSIIKEAIEKYDCDLIVHNANRVFDDGKITQGKTVLNHGEIFEGRKKEKAYKLFLSGKVFGSMCAKAIKREIIDIDTDYTKYSFVCENEDTLQMLPIVKNAKKIVYLDKYLYFYRFNHVSMSRSFRVNKYRSVRAVGNKLYEYALLWKADLKTHKQLHIRNLRVIVSIATQVGHESCNLDEKQKIEYLREMAYDTLFMKAYAGADIRNMDALRRLICWLLYKHRFKTIILLSKISYILNYREFKFWNKKRAKIIPTKT